MNPIKPLAVALLAMTSAMAGTMAYAQAAPSESRGELLYNTHCISCHTTQMHWRSARKATDWDSLKVQVERWQSNAGLQWGEGDVLAVTRYLNATIYNYPGPGDARASVR